MGTIIIIIIIINIIYNININNIADILDHKANTVEPLYNEVLGITNDFLYPSHSKIMKKNLDIANTFCQSLGPSLNRGSTVVYIFFNQASPCVKWTKP